MIHHQVAGLMLELLRTSSTWSKLFLGTRLKITTLRYKIAAPSREPAQMSRKILPPKREATLQRCKHCSLCLIMDVPLDQHFCSNSQEFKLILDRLFTNHKRYSNPRQKSSDAKLYLRYVLRTYLWLSVRLVH